MNFRKFLLHFAVFQLVGDFLSASVLSCFQFCFQRSVFIGKLSVSFIVLFQLCAHGFRRWNIFIQQCSQFFHLRFLVKKIGVCHERHNLFLHSAQMNHFLEYSRWNMAASGLAGTLTALQIGIFLDHMLPKPVLPLRQLLLVTNDFLGAEPSVLRQRDKRKVHMGCFLVHMHHSRYNCFWVLMLLNKVQRLLKIGFDLVFLLSFEELWRCGYKCLHHAHAVRACTAASVLDLSLCLCPVFLFRRNQVKIQVAAALVDVWIAGVFFLGALVVRLNIGNLRSFVLGKSENRKLRLTHLSLPPFLPYEVIPQHISQFHDFFVADALPLQLGRQVGNAVRPAVFVMQQVNDLLHRKTGADDLRFDFVAYIHIQILPNSDHETAKQVRTPTHPFRCIAKISVVIKSVQNCRCDVLFASDTY